VNPVSESPAVRHDTALLPQSEGLTAIMTPKIAIVGAGPAGLTLANIIYRNGITTTVFERDASTDARSQGGSLDLHPETGQAALEACGLISHFQVHARFKDQDLTIALKSGKRLVEVREEDRGRPEIDRAQLRKILLDALPQGIVKWNHQVVSASMDTLEFKTHTESGFDLIVGADGAWSKVRLLCTYVQPFYSGVTGVEMVLKNASLAHPDISQMVGNGSMFCFGSEEGHNIFYQRNSDDLIRAYAFGQRPENWAQNSGINWSNPADVRAKLSTTYINWTPELRQVIMDCDDNIQVRPLYMLPVGLTWPSQASATLVGDAAHLMNPFGGEGVNMAMRDALDLALMIIKQPNDIPLAIKEYETIMWPRAEKAADKAWRGTLSRFAPGGGEDFANLIKKMKVSKRH
jgi:2-polyprenyl-6-methoxyphenol hydroxylase-like FAD-dependent oxidoreductase